MGYDPGAYAAYVFIRDPGQSPRSTKEGLAALPGVYFAAEFVGSFVVFGAVQVPDLTRLHDLIDSAYEVGARSEWSTVITASALAMPKRGSPPFCALVRASALDVPEKVLSNLDLTFRKRFEADPAHGSFWYGAAVVSGRDFDLLIDLGSDDPNELKQVLLPDLRATPGVGRTDTSFAFLPGNAWRDGKPQEA